MTNQTQTLTQNNYKKVNWIIFVWVVGIISLAIGWLFVIYAGLNQKIEETNKDNTEIKMDVREIKTNTAWIMEALKKDKK